MFEIIDLKSEAALQLEGDPKIWTTNGEIAFQDLKLRYRQSTPLVLKGISFIIKPGQHVQVEQVQLHKVRQNIGIIPQCPFLFGGTIKRNLDPLEQYTDQQLWDTLKKNQLFDYVYQLANQLNTEINNDISVGQKQLICLARVIFSKKKIIVLDEATANLDSNSDNIIQQIIKRFQATIITNAHRLNTNADYDLVMVISDGEVKEIGKPLDLLCSNLNDTDVTAQTEFAEMVKATGIENSRNIIKLARN